MLKLKSKKVEVRVEPDESEDEKPPPAKKLRIKKKDFLKSIKEQIQSEIIKDIVVGSVEAKDIGNSLAPLRSGATSFYSEVEAESWQRRCEIVPGVYIDLLDPDTSELPLTTSPFGYKKETRVDLEVRDCKEVSLSQCSRQLRILAQEIVDSKEKYCEPHKLVVYEEGGHFEQHTDTPEKDLSESLVLHLPTDCKGGDLVFNSWNPSQHYAPNVINYTLFSINHPHRVTRVTKGKRISLLFKVFNLPQEKRTKTIISGEHCHCTITVPASYKNVLFTYPNKEVIKKLLTTSKLKFEEVYYEDPYPEEVYTGVETFDEYSDRYPDDPGLVSVDGFSALLENATVYKVKHMVDVGEPSEKSESYSYHGYTGNEGFSGSGVVEYLVGYLVNPSQPKKYMDS